MNHCAICVGLWRTRLIEKMKEEMPFYLAACSIDPLLVNRCDVKDFTSKVLKMVAWWADADKSNDQCSRRGRSRRASSLRSHSKFSSVAERVFSLVKLMFGYVQDSATSNLYIQAALMLKYNQHQRWADNATVGSAVWRRARLIAGLRKGECLLCERSEQGICF